MAEPRAFPQMFLRPYAGALVISTVVSIVAAAAALAQPLAMQGLLEHINHSNEAAIGDSLTFLLVVTVAEAAAVGTQTFLLYRVGANAVARVRTTLVSRILRWPLPRYSVFGRGTLTTVTTADSGAMHTLIAGGIFEIFTASMLTVGAVIFMYFISPPLTVITLGVVIVAVLIVVLSTHSVRRDSRLAQEHTAAMADQLGATLGAIRTFRASGSVNGREEAINHEVEQTRQATYRVGRRLSWVDPISNVVVQGAFISVLGIGGMMAYSGEITLAQLMAFLMYLMMTLMPIESGLGALPALQRSLGSWDRVRRLLSGHLPTAAEESTESAADDGRPLSSAIVTARSLHTSDEPGIEAPSLTELTRPCGPAARLRRPPRIALRGIGHTFGPRPIFDQVQATFPAGSITALWGPSGTGKSTMMDILAGLVEPRDGEVWVDGAHRELVEPSSYLEQRAPIVKGTIRDNLRLGAPDATDTEMLDVLGRVGLMHLTDRGGAGLDAHVGEEGLELSGGEGQRLALARLLLKPEPLILLDEPTSRVDIATEQLIHQAIESLRGKHTIVIATHREATRDLCDHVVEFRRRDSTESPTPSPVHPQLSIGS